MMRHLGDIKKIDGAKIPVVDCIVGGSPCQDLSVAGKRGGLSGERSGLFIEQIRIVKEMRDRDRAGGRTDQYIRPRYLVWENVEGALSSPGRDNKGEDFRAVLEEVIRIAEPTAPDVPLPPRGIWPKSGTVVDELGRWSVAWRVVDAQYWGASFESDGRVLDLGTPQRRRRIALIADFGGTTACQILFEPQGLSRDYHQGRTERKEPAGGTREGSGGTSYTLKIRGGVERDSSGRKAGKGPLIQTEMSGTLGVSQDQTLITVGYDAQECFRFQRFGQYTGSDKASTLRSRGEPDVDLIVMATGQANAEIMRDGCPTLNCTAEQPILFRGGDQIKEPKTSVRRLTPTECARLQGFPDTWLDIGDWVDDQGRKHKESDGPKYRALGNSICTPFWFVLMRRISAQYERPATLGSLFDGIGGFPYCWARCNGSKYVLWASEIEPFPIAVVKKHFGDEDAGIEGDIGRYL